MDKNSWSNYGNIQTQLFLEKYSFIDTVYVDFLNKIGGVEIYSKNYLLILYGFALSEAELIFPIDQYLKNDYFLAIGEYTEKRQADKWKGIGYFYCSIDKEPVIYTQFNQDERDELRNRYFPTFLGFEEFLLSITTKSYAEQLIIATDR